ncbi:MAG: hypothetical protein WBM90_13215 [Acidimicrobiia bacterium]
MKMLTRAGRAAILDRRAFTEAFFDGDAAADAAIIVAGVGGLTYAGFLLRVGALGAFDLASLIQVLIASVVSWLILAFATWFVATRLFQSSGRPQTMMALQGLAALPLLLEIFGRWMGGVGLIWYLVVLVLATQEASELKTKDAAVSVLIGFAVAALARALIGVPFAILGGIFG